MRGKGVGSMTSRILCEVVFTTEHGGELLDNAVRILRTRRAVDLDPSWSVRRFGPLAVAFRQWSRSDAGLDDGVVGSPVLVQRQSAFAEAGINV